MFRHSAPDLGSVLEKTRLEDFELPAGGEGAYQITLPVGEGLNDVAVQLVDKKEHVADQEGVVGLAPEILVALINEFADETLEKIPQATRPQLTQSCLKAIGERVVYELRPTETYTDEVLDLIAIIGSYEVWLTEGAIRNIMTAAKHLIDQLHAKGIAHVSNLLGFT